MVNDEETLRVKGSTSATSLGSAIAQRIYEGKKVSLRSIGAAAGNQANKAIAIASGLVAPRGHVLYVQIGFTDVEMPDGVVTAMIHKLRVE